MQLPFELPEYVWMLEPNAIIRCGDIGVLPDYFTLEIGYRIESYSGIVARADGCRDCCAHASASIGKRSESTNRIGFRDTRKTV